MRMAARNQNCAVTRTFTAQVILDQTIVDNVCFIVIEGRGQPLLGRPTALALKVLILDRYRRIATLKVRDKLNKMLGELVALDFIEEVSRSSSLVSPVVVVPKENDIRLCVDMCQADADVKWSATQKFWNFSIKVNISVSLTLTRHTIKLNWHLSVEISRASLGTKD